MCGFTGFISLKNNLAFDGLGLVAEMGRSISHRGPDSHSEWHDKENGVYLSHRRLSIHDLSNDGIQPMTSNSGRYVIAYNGEIYNYKKIRKTLNERGIYGKQGESDTKVILDAIELWGVKESLTIFNGMFAFALWDNFEESLYLVRDRFGEKPLYYGLHGNSFIFGSELKSLKLHPEFSPEICCNSLSLYLKYSYIPAPFSIYKDTFKLLPGHLIKITQNNIGTPEEYWSLSETVTRSKKNSFDGSYEEAKKHLDTMLRDSIRDRIQADVPVGTMLSGGVDSSLTTAIAADVSSQKIKSFTVAVDTPGFNEAMAAKEVSRHLDTEHTELHFNMELLIDTIPKLSEIYDEPFADSSQIPTYLVSNLVKDHVTVAISGDAGDEIFGGYTRYFQSDRLWDVLKRSPYFLRRLSKSAILTVPPNSIDRLLRPIKSILPGELAVGHIGSRIHKLANVLDVKSTDDLYDRLISNEIAPETLLLDSSGLTMPAYISAPSSLQSIEKMMYCDSLGYLPGDILTKVDRASMAVSLETRIPFLDHDIAAFAWSLPLDMKVYKNTGKRILKDLLYTYVPRKLVDRPKQGFGLPLDYLLRTTLKDWASSLLDETRIKQDGFFNAKIISELWMQHSAGDKNHSHQIWSILMFNQWLDGERGLA